MQLDFFPSRTLTFYLARLFVSRLLAVLIMLVLVLQTLDLLGESGKILAYKGNGQAQLWTYVTLRIPQIISFFMPYSALLATIITLATLNQNSEVIAMKASGMSAHQVLAPLLLAALVVALAIFAFNERVVTRSSATLKAWSSVDYGPVPKDSGVRNNVYLADGDNILTAVSISGRGNATVMTGVTWYRRDGAGMVVETIRGQRATYAGPGWRIENATRFTVAGTITAKVPQVVVAPGLTAAEVAVGSVNPEGQSLMELSRSIAALKAEGRRTSSLEAEWWHKFSGPLSAVLMPLLGAVAAFGLARSGALLVRSIVGMALGFAYFVADNATMAMGDFGAYGPLVAAWAPFVLFALIGEAVLIRTEE
jgi:lipopolysaccharide export system permease protein